MAKRRKPKEKEGDGPQRKSGHPKGIADISTFGGVLTEMRSVYRAVATGKIKSGEGYTRVSILREIRMAMESNDIERKLNELTALLAQRGITA